MWCSDPDDAVRAEISPVRSCLVFAKHRRGTTNQLRGPVRAEACEEAAAAADRTTGLCLGSAGQPGISVWNDYGNVKRVSVRQGRTSSRNGDVCLAISLIHLCNEGDTSLFTTAGFCYFFFFIQTTKPLSKLVQ